MPVEPLLLELVKLSAVGLIAGLFASFIQNRDHRQRKWWELRVQAYQNAIEALSDLAYYYGKHVDAEVEYRKLSPEFAARLATFEEQAFPKVRKYADSGAFLFSDRANAALKQFIEDEYAQSYIEHLDANFAKAKHCLSELIECSKVDLKL